MESMKTPTQKGEKKVEKTYVKTVRDIEDKAVAANIYIGQSADGMVSHYYRFSRSWKTLSTGKQGYSDRFYPRNANAVGRVAELAAKECERLDKGPQVSQGIDQAA